MGFQWLGVLSRPNQDIQCHELKIKKRASTFHLSTNSWPRIPAVLHGDRSRDILYK